MSAPARRFAVFAIAYTGARDFVPLYAVYALLFQAQDVSEAGISTLFLLWSLTSFVAEVPSGAWADLVSRRLLLALGSLLTAVGFALWIVVPTFPGFLAGFVLWGVGGALVSGTWESLVYDALAERGETGRYAAIIGGGESASWVAAVASAALTTPLLAAGGYALVGWVSVATTLLHAVVSLRLPDPPRTGVDPDEVAEDGAVPVDANAADEVEWDGAVAADAQAPRDEDDVSVSGAVREYVDTLTAGVREATTHPPVRRAVIGLSLLTGLLAFDEYLPLVAAGTGVDIETVPLLVTMVYVTQAVASALAGPAAGLADRWISRLLVVGGILIAVGALLGTPLGFGLLAVGYGAMTCVMIVGDARLQDAITGRARATVTSTVGLGSELMAVVVFAGYAAGSTALGLTVLVALNGVALLGVAGILPRRGVA